MDRRTDPTAGRATTSGAGETNSQRAGEGERPPVPAEPRQRWRLTVARDVVPGDQVGRAGVDAWHGALEASGLPVAGLDVPGGRPKLAFGAPLPAAARGEAELVEIWLLERLPLWRVREALSGMLPAGFRLIHAEDVWLGAPALPGQVAAADWAVTVTGVDDAGALDPERLSAAAAAVMESTSIVRTRGKPGAEKPYDLRPLLISLAVHGSTGGVAPERPASDRIQLRMRTRLDPERGTGRPEEVVGALADVAGIGLAVVDLVRTRLLLASDLLD